jgi:hypothetical protein
VDNPGMNKKKKLRDASLNRIFQGSKLRQHESWWQIGSKGTYKLWFSFLLTFSTSHFLITVKMIHKISWLSPLCTNLAPTKTWLSIYQPKVIAAKG